MFSYLLEVGAPIDPELTADAEEGGDVGPLGAGAGTSLHRGKAPRARQHRATQAAALVQIGARAAGSEGEGRSKAPA